MFEEQNFTNAPEGADGGQRSAANQNCGAAIHQSPEGERAAPFVASKPAQGSAARENTPADAFAEDLRFADPLVAEIVQWHRMRRRWMKAKNALVLQGKAACRGLTEGDKDAANAMWDRIAKGKGQPDDHLGMIVTAPFLAAAEQFDSELARIGRDMEKLAKRLPIAPWVKTVTGLGWGSVAAIVGEAGDLSKYPSVAGVWKRMGMAVIDGDGRQRKVASAEGALIHGYSPERRSVVWVMADSMAKLQRTWFDKETGEVRKPAGPYGEVLEAEKAKALEKGLSKIHAENRAKRHMSKRILRDMTVEWRRAVGHLSAETQAAEADSATFLMAAE